jgi:hypothetical protein
VVRRVTLRDIIELMPKTAWHCYRNGRRESRDKLRLGAGKVPSKDESHWTKDHLTH